MATTRKPSGATRVRVLLAVGAAVTMLLAPSTGGAEDPIEMPYVSPHDLFGPFPHLDLTEPEAVVRIGDQGLWPAVVKLREGERLGWASIAQGPSVIVFEKEVARSMVCSSVVNFSLEGDELRSGELYPGDFASFCELAPGRYRYRVDNSFVSARRYGRARLEGQIIVSAR